MKIAFICLGHMGAPMALNLLKGGHQLRIFDVAKKNLEAATAQGAEPARSAADAVSDAQIVITMLPSSPHVKSVYLAEDGVLAGAAPGAILIDSSTIDPHSAREVAVKAIERGFLMADAPVSGGTGGAQAGTLTFMVGSSAEVF